MKSLLIVAFLLLEAATAAKRFEPLELPLVHRAAHSVGAAGTEGDTLLFNLSIGTPPQTFTLAVDSYQVWSWVLDVNCEYVASGRRTYDASKSSTSTRGPSGLYCYAAEYEPYCQFYSDYVNVTIGDSSFRWNQTFGSAVEFYNFDQQFPADGVLGLSWTVNEAQAFKQRLQSTYNDETDPSDVLIFNLLTNFEQHVFTLWIGARPPAGQSLANGQLTIGGTDATNCDADINYVLINLEDEYQLIDIKGFRVGSFETRRRRAALFDTGSSSLVLDQQAYDAVYYAVQPDYSWDAHVLTVDCSQAALLPDLVFFIGNGNYTVSTQNYVLDIGLADNKCAVVISLSDTDQGAHYQLGLPFMREKCLVYDVDQQRVGLAQGNKQ